MFVEVLDTFLLPEKLRKKYIIVLLEPIVPSHILLFLSWGYLTVKINDFRMLSVLSLAFLWIIGNYVTPSGCGQHVNRIHLNLIWTTLNPPSQENIVRIIPAKVVLSGNLDQSWRRPNSWEYFQSSQTHQPISRYSFSETCGSIIDDVPDITVQIYPLPCNIWL